jgi:hypothetical protein
MPMIPEASQRLSIGRGPIDEAMASGAIEC